VPANAKHCISSIATLGLFGGVPEFQPPQTGSVDNGATLRSDEQLARGCRVSAATIVTPNFLCHLHVATEQPVRQCRFPHARRAKKRYSAIALEILFENLHAMARERADRMNWQVRCNSVDLAGRPALRANDRETSES
jgi:hypothetical protein